jgi:hypothetical protein
MPRDLTRTFKAVNSFQVELIYIPPERKMLTTSEGYIVLRMTVRTPKANCIVRETFFAWDEQQKARDYYDGAISALS